MSYDPVLRAGLAAPVTTLVLGVEILHPYRTIRLVDGGFVIFEGHTYVSDDPDIGSLGGIEGLTEGVGEEAPALALAINQVNAGVGVELCKPNAQGAPVKCWLGVVKPETGQLEGQPLVFFVGEIDVPTLGVGEGGNVSFECTSVFERFFETDEGARMSATFLRSLFPDDAGFDFMTTVAQSMPWGKEGAKPTLSSRGGYWGQVINDLKNQQYS